MINSQIMTSGIELVVFVTWKLREIHHVQITKNYNQMDKLIDIYLNRYKNIARQIWSEIKLAVNEMWNPEQKTNQDKQET